MDTTYLGTVLVIGNGFDLDLGLKTRYSDFANSNEWKNMFEQSASKSKHYSLLKFLNDKKDEHCWFDIEQALLEYASIKTKSVWLHDVKTDKQEYDEICNTLGTYLDNQLKDLNLNIFDKKGIQLLRNIFQSDSFEKYLYTFNYTPIEKIAKSQEIIHITNAHYVHGKIEDKTHIMGIDVQILDDIIPEYSFLIKSNNNNYQAVNIELDMINAKEVIIFGHSLNMIDAVYFDDYLKNLSTNKDEHRRLTIITNNETSKLQILDNIRRMGISVPKLYSHGHLEFILTENKEASAFKQLLERV